MKIGHKDPCVCMVFQTLSIKYHILIETIDSKTLTIVAQESWSFEKWNSYSLPKSGDSNSTVKLSSEACDPCQGQVPMGIFRAHSHQYPLSSPRFLVVANTYRKPKKPPQSAWKKSHDLRNESLHPFFHRWHLLATFLWLRS